MNYIIIFVALGVIAGVVYISKKTLEKLDTKIQPFYEFSLSLPSSGKWSILFFLIIISILTLVVLLSSGQTILLRPA